MLSQMNYRKETQPHGDELFPLSIHVFETDLQSTVRVYCHWHEEVELFYAVKGEAVFHMSESAFCRFFKSIMHISAVTYVNNLRIAESCRLLLSAEEAISKIASDCGFRNTSQRPADRNGDPDSGNAKRRDGEKVCQRHTHAKRNDGQNNERTGDFPAGQIVIHKETSFRT